MEQKYRAFDKKSSSSSSLDEILIFGHNPTLTPLQGQGAKSDNELSPCTEND